MSALASASATRLRIPVLVGLMAVTAATLLLLLNPGDAEAQAGRDLTVDVSKVGPSPEVPLGNKVAFKVTVSNGLAEQANNVLTRVSMPAGFTSLSTEPVPGSGFTCNISGSTVQCMTPTLGGNSQKTFGISTIAPATISGASQSFTLKAQVDPNETVGERDEGNNLVVLNIKVVTRPNLRVDLPNAPGQALTTQVAPDLNYLADIDNNGGGAAPNLLVRFTLPKDVAFVKVEQNELGTCFQNSKASNGALQVNCTLSSLPAGAKRGVRIIGKVLGSVPDGVQVIFAANIDPDNSVPESNESDNTTGMVTTLRAKSDLQVTGTVTTRNPGSTVVFEGGHPGDLLCARATFVAALTVRNNGPYQSRSTTLTATWPAQVSAAPDVSFDFKNIPALNPGQSTQAHLGGLISVLPPSGVRLNATFLLDENQTLFDPVVGNNRTTLTVCGP